MSTDVILVHEKVADAFGKAIAEQVKQLKADPKDGLLRGLFNVRSTQRLDGYIKDALDKGAKIVAGKHESSHNVLQPLILGGITDDMRASEPPRGGFLADVVRSRRSRGELWSAPDYAQLHDRRRGRQAR